ncbi:MAG: hypothetical protein ACRDOO_00290, partial [Actinomadura sp.]
MRYWTLIEIPYTGDASGFRDARHAVLAELPNITNIERRIPGFSIMTRGGDTRASVCAVIEAPGPLEAVSITMLVARTAINASKQDDCFDTTHAVLRVAPADQAEWIY